MRVAVRAGSEPAEVQPQVIRDRWYASLPVRVTCAGSAVPPTVTWLGNLFDCRDGEGNLRDAQVEVAGAVVGSATRVQYLGELER
jgi:hypothetical protein